MRTPRSVKSLVATSSIAVALTALAVSHPHADGPYAPGILLVSRSTYAGVPTSVPFPGSLPNNAASVADGTFPNVFNNETPDGSFGITSPILVDQLMTSGALISTTDVTNALLMQQGANVATSFPSKSELGLHLTPDLTAVTFMAYGAAVNQLDVSNASTPGHVDITDPVNGQGVLIAQRDVVELRADGAVQATGTNTYSGNNGRNVLLGSNGYYFIVGNAGNNGSITTYKSGVLLPDESDNAFSELFQQFIPGTVLGFTVTTTNNVDVPSPDAFAWSVLDNTLSNLPTTGLGDSLLVVNIGPSDPIQTAETTSPQRQLHRGASPLAQR